MVNKVIVHAALDVGKWRPFFDLFLRYSPAISFAEAREKYYESLHNPFQDPLPMCFIWGRARDVKDGWDVINELWDEDEDPQMVGAKKEIRIEVDSKLAGQKLYVVTDFRHEYNEAGVETVIFETEEANE